MGKREHPPAYATLRDGILLGGTAKIMADINVVVSGAFFGGYQRKVIDAVAGAPISAAATEEIVREYTQVAHRLQEKGQRNYDSGMMDRFIARLELVSPQTKIHVSRDPDDDKFISSACDAHALHIVSGDQDLLVLEHYADIEIVTAKEFCNRYL